MSQTTTAPIVSAIRAQFPAFQAWCKANQKQALAIRDQRQVAALKRAEVDAYVRPLFDSFGFTDEEREPIGKPSDLYLCTDDALCAAFFTGCDTLHRQHGFEGKKGYCPALIEETKLMDMEWRLIEEAVKVLKMPAPMRTPENRDKILGLILKCMKL